MKNKQFMEEIRENIKKMSINLIKSTIFTVSEKRSGSKRATSKKERLSYFG